MKRELRKQLKLTLAAMSSNEMAVKSASIAEKLFTCKHYKKAETIMLFLSLPTEVDTTAICLRAWQDSKRVLVPKVSWEQRRMMPVEVRSLTTDLTTNQFGVREPIHGPPCPIALIDLVLVPGLGFDGSGNRLGRGRGFYDRFLANPQYKAVSCGLSFEEQLVDEVPCDSLDMKVDMLVTDAEVRVFK